MHCIGKGTETNCLKTVNICLIPLFYPTFIPNCIHHNNIFPEILSWVNVDAFFPKIFWERVMTNFLDLFRR